MMVKQVASVPLGAFGPTRLEAVTYGFRDGRVKTIGVVRRPDAVGVLPVRHNYDTDTFEVFLVVQPRPAIGDNALIEIVAGKMDQGENDPEVTARRELAEEVGLTAEAWLPLHTQLVASPGYTTERIHLFACWHITDVPSRPEDDDIKGEWLPLDEAVEMVHPDGLIVDLKTIAALLIVDRRHRDGPPMVAATRKVSDPAATV